jgi:hypothetical protein
MAKKNGKKKMPQNGSILDFLPNENPNGRSKAF